jgi:hypothetical protein
MSENNPNAELAATPGSTRAGVSRGKSANGKRVLGKLEELGGLVYKFNSKDQADLYLRTTEAIADYVGVEYGRNMRMLVKHGTETTFTKPRAPRKEDSTPGLLEEFKTELSIYHRDTKEYKEQKAKVFVIILGQCTPSLKSKLANDAGFATLEQNDDVKGLLGKLKELAFSTGGVQHPFWTLQNMLRRLTAINQGEKESVQNYHKRFLAMTEVIEAQWGQFCPTELADSNSAADKKKARDQLLSMIFLAGADKTRYGKLVESLNNSYLTKTDNYPLDDDSTVTLLSHYQDHKARGIQVNDNDGGVEASFAQVRRKSRIRCYKCNELGHVAQNCPLNQGRTTARSHLQRGEESEDDEAGSVASSIGSGGRRSRSGWYG